MARGLSKTSKYLSPEVRIQGNTMSFNGNSFQISNISRIWLGESPKSIWWLIFGILTFHILIGLYFLYIYFFKKIEHSTD